MGPRHDEQRGAGSPVADPGVPVETEYLDLDDYGVPDAVQTSQTFEYGTAGGADVVEAIRELDSGIGPDGVPTTVTVTDTVAIDTDHDGAPNAAEVVTVTVHPDAAPGAH